MLLVHGDTFSGKNTEFSEQDFVLVCMPVPSFCFSSTVMGCATWVPSMEGTAISTIWSFAEWGHLLTSASPCPYLPDFYVSVFLSFFLLAHLSFLVFLLLRQTKVLIAFKPRKQILEKVPDYLVRQALLKQRSWQPSIPVPSYVFSPHSARFVLFVIAWWVCLRSNGGGTWISSLLDSR